MHFSSWQQLKNTQHLAPASTDSWCTYAVLLWECVCTRDKLIVGGANDFMFIPELYPMRPICVDQ